MIRAHEQYERQATARAKLVEAARKISEGQEALRAAVVEARQVNLTQTEIAKLGNISRPTVSYWIREAGQWDSSGEA